MFASPAFFCYCTSVTLCLSFAPQFVQAFPERLNYGEVASTGAGPEWEFGGGRGPVAAGGGGGVRSALREFDERLRQLSTVEPYSQMAASDEELDRLEALREVIGRAVGFPSTVGGQDQWGKMKRSDGGGARAKYYRERTGLRSLLSSIMEYIASKQQQQQQQLQQQLSAARGGNGGGGGGGVGSKAAAKKSTPISFTRL